MGHINQKCTIDNLPYLFLLYCLYHKYVCHAKHFTVIFKFSGHVRLRKCIWLHMLSTFEHKLPSIDVGLWTKIEGFCHLHAKLIVKFLQYLLLAVTQQSSTKVIYMGQCFFSSIDVRTIHSFLLFALYSFACDVPNKYSIMHTCIKKIDRNFQWVYR